MSGPSLAREVDVEQAGGIGIGYATVHLLLFQPRPNSHPPPTQQRRNSPGVHGNSDRDGCRSRGCPASEAYPTQDWPSGPACPTLWLCTPLPLCHPLLFFLGTVSRPFMAPPLMEHATPLPTNFITCKAYDYIASMDYVIIAFQPPSSVWALLQLSLVSVIGGGDAGQCTTNMHTLEDLLLSILPQHIPKCGWILIEAVLRSFLRMSVVPAHPLLNNMAPHHLQFISYVPPAPFGTSEGSVSAPDPPPKRPRGRPKGSKNKAKDESPTQLVHTTAPGGAQSRPSVPLPTSYTDQLPPAIEIPRQLVRNEADRNEPVELANMVAHTDIIHSHPSTLRRDVDAQTHSHVHSHRSTVRRDVDVQTTPSVPSVRTPHTSPAPRADVPPFPEWFQKRVRTLLDELKDDLRTAGQSRHYKAGQFWIRANSVWSSLKGTTLKPTDLFTPDFFLWDPLNLLGKSHTLRCPMPNCLTRGGVVNRPRRVVDVDSTFWLIGYTYECQKTATGGCDARFRSWDQRILQRLPRALAAEFPAHLTWRSGLSTRAFGVVRSCFQHGMGSEEVADMFRMQHLRRYDELRLQYLRTKINQMGFSETYEPFLPFEDRSQCGFHGFTPSGQWLRDIYDAFIESHRDTMNQNMAMCSLRLGKIDHSHKIAKHIFKVDGVPIFTALLTVTNEKAEIRVCVFVATKSHSQYEEALRRLANDLPIYGHELPEVFYTDNMSDKPMLEKMFPSLRAGVVPVEKYSHLPMFVSPEFVRQPQELDTQISINNVMRSICDEIPVNGNIVIGFDSEWNVDVAPHGRLSGQDRRDAEFVNLLRSPQVIKAGRQVNGDLQRLAVAAGYPPNYFSGAVDLAAFAKTRFLVTKATLSLADLFAVIFHKCLPKNDAERVSSNWSDKELSDAQKEYAARDAYASLLLYHEINKTPLPLPFSTTATMPCGTPVLLLTDDNKKLAARGVISPAASEDKFNGENLTKTRTVITIQEILVPGAVIGQNKEKGSGRKLSLQDFGETTQHPMPENHPPVNFHPPLDEHGIEMISVAEELEIADGDDGVPEANTEASREQDATSAAEGETILGPAILPAYAWLIRSRVLKDIFHVFHMIYISRTHGLRQAFCQALRDAMLIPHPADKALIEAYLKTHNVTWENMRRFHPKWLWRHCRRTIPPAEKLYPVVHKVFMTYGPLKDAKTGLPLFNTAAWKIAKNILELIKNGYVSDVPGVQLYVCLGFDLKAGGLPIYRCERGTNDVEGAVHTHLLSKLPSHGASVGHFNSTGRKYLGHDSIWLLNEIQELEITLGEHYNCLPAQLAWVNGNLYRKTEQTAGTIQIPKSVRELVKIQPFK
ncbi:hypothetical protein DFH07DRAFT_774427 [Mycena maculata]|uniref:3'-5' exonuclease domain-containing protein n=1 Tax=Mycena maculata TaxID=230809 RepID=A0AAD7IXA9_9AGAR|nr:hypothetical protein DFH07DRAFT_774427 [Mycena maculata]